MRWFFTPTSGFFSVVRRCAGEHVTIRARSRADLDDLRARYLPSLGKARALGDTQRYWRYRATATSAAFGEAMIAIVVDLAQLATAIVNKRARRTPPTR